MLPLNEYWKRAWIVQEIALAKDVIFLFEEGLVLLEHVDEVLRRVRLTPVFPMDERTKHLDYIGARAYNTEQYGRFAFDVLNEHEASRKVKSRTLADMLWRHGQAKCSDPRDSVYALISLIDWEEKERLSADYSMSCSALCRKLQDEYDVSLFQLPRRLALTFD